MLGKTYDTQTCSIARALEVVGERWSLLVIRDAHFAGLTRFTDFQRSLGIATNVLRDRLEAFVEVGIMTRRRYSEAPEQHEYLLTEMGRDLVPTLVALTEWGDRWAAPDGRPIVYRHAGCGSEVHAELVCERHGVIDGLRELENELGPGMSAERMAVMDGIFADRARDPRLATAGASEA
jgi:DNA-binding HxlR family transcriptional regulator